MNFYRIQSYRLTCAMSQRSPLNPSTSVSRGRGARDGRYSLGCLQQWSYLLAQRAATIQLSLPVKRSCLSDHCKHRPNRYRENSAFHVMFKTGGKTILSTFSEKEARQILQALPPAVLRLRRNTRSLAVRAAQVASSRYTSSWKTGDC